jgi:hypothetical protein
VTATPTMETNGQMPAGTAPGPAPAGGTPPATAAPVAWYPAHGGAGATTLAWLIGGADLGAVQVAPGTPVVVVARTNAWGLRAAQSCAAAWPAWAMRPVGIVLIADAPGRLPRSLRELAHLVTGGYDRVWTIPWIPSLREGDPPPDIRPLRRLAKELALPGIRGLHR